MREVQMAESLRPNATVPSKIPATRWEDQWPTYDGYEALNGSQREIRLLDMHICRDSQVLRTCLRRVSLNEAPDYCALSYSWGAPVHKRKHLPVSVDDSQVLVRPTLAHFLFNLVQLVGPMTVWLDALCINQRDLLEKKQQVGMMGTIYAKARKTYVWLGQGSAESDHVFQSLNNESVQPVAEQDFEIYTRQILQQLYWSRAWIVQEYALSKEVTLVMGNYMVAADDFLRNISTKIIKDAEVSKLNSIKAQIDGRLHSLGSLDSLIELAIKFKDYGCSDPKDRFYSLLSLVDTGLEPDYTLPAFEVIFRIIHSLSSSCKVACENPLKVLGMSSMVTYFLIMAACLRPSVHDLMRALRSSSSPFALSLEATQQISEVKRHVNKLSTQNEAQPETWYIQKDVMAKLNGAYLFQLSPDFYLRSLHIAVTKSYEVVGVIIEDIWVRDAKIQDLSLRDLCILSSIVSQNLKACRGKGSQRYQIERHLSSHDDYHCFHIHKTILVLLALIRNRRQNSPGDTLVRRKFFAHLKRNGLENSPVSSACEATERISSTNQSVWDVTGQEGWDFKLWNKVKSVLGTEGSTFEEPLRTVKNLFPELDFESPKSEDLDQTLPTDDYIKCDVWME